MTPALSKKCESVVFVIISIFGLLLLVDVIIAVPHCMQIAFATKQRLAGRYWSCVKAAVRGEILWWWLGQIYERLI